jgi:hypothetical protein
VSLKHIRKFPRLEISEETRVQDEGGRELGIVSEVSGNGMGLLTSSLAVAQSLELGQRMRVTIVEPGSRATNVAEVVVRFRDGKKVGMEFVEPSADDPR